MEQEGVLLMTSRMTATDELRRLLDGRGIEHMDFNMPDKFLTMFGGGEHDGAYTENSVDTILTVYGASPAQAVEATLGSDLQAENDKLRELVRFIMHQCNDGNPRCDECIGWNDGECVALLRMRELGVDA